MYDAWVPVSSTGKVSCCRVRDLGSNPAYTKNQLVSWSDGKEQPLWADPIDLNSIIIIKKKIHSLNFRYYITFV